MSEQTIDLICIAACCLIVAAGLVAAQVRRRAADNKSNASPAAPSAPCGKPKPALPPPVDGKPLISFRYNRQTGDYDTYVDPRLTEEQRREAFAPLVAWADELERDRLQNGVDATAPYEERVARIRRAGEIAGVEVVDAMARTKEIGK